MGRFIRTEWVIKPFDFESTVKHAKPTDINHKFRILDKKGNVFAYGYSARIHSLVLLKYCKKYGCKKDRVYVSKHI